MWRSSVWLAARAFAASCGVAANAPGFCLSGWRDDLIGAGGRSRLGVLEPRWHFGGATVFLRDWRLQPQQRAQVRPSDSDQALSRAREITPVGTLMHSDGCTSSHH